MTRCIFTELLSSAVPVLECFSGLRGVCVARLAIMLIILLHKMKKFRGASPFVNMPHLILSMTFYMFILAK